MAETLVNKYVVCVIRTKIAPDRYRWVFDPYQTFPNLDKGGEDVRRRAWERATTIKTLTHDAQKLKELFGVTNIDAVYPVTITDLLPMETA